eukprot:scaffold10417_cov137-Skeletonema_marinoi.AAC.21
MLCMLKLGSGSFYTSHTDPKGDQLLPSSHMLISTKKVLVIDGIMAEHHRYCSDIACCAVFWVALQKNYEHQNPSDRAESTFGMDRLRTPNKSPSTLAANLCAMMARHH